MIRERLTAMLVPLAALLLLVTGCDDLALPDSAPETPAASPAAGASATPTAAPSPRAAPVLTPDGPLYIIVTNTGGEGVAVRDACDPDARVSAPGEGIRDGSFVEFLRGGTGDCGGWMYVRDRDGRESWVRAGYLGPVPAPLPTPEAGDNATPDGTADVIVAATPEVSPTRRTDSFFQLYGFAPPGNVITASIDGSPCASTVVNATSEWIIYVYRRDCDDKAQRGAVISFTVNGARANETEIWSSGGGPSDRVRGVTLTIAYEPQ